MRQKFILLLLICLVTSTGRSDETHARYLEQLRQRGLFSLAEAEAIARMANAKLSPADKTLFAIELSRTLTEHAGFVSDDQRDELWQRAQSVIQDLLDQDRQNPKSVLLNGQLASVLVSQGDWLRAERELRPFDELILNQARAVSTKATQQLQVIEKTLTEPSRDVKRTGSGSPSGYELRALLHQVRWQLAQSSRNLAELEPIGSVERSTNAINAEQSLRSLIGVADEPVRSLAKVMLVTCSRLKGDVQRASDMLTGLEKSDPNPGETVLDAIVAERVRVLLELQHPTEAVQLLLKTRNRRQRLTGEMWFLQTRALIALREITLDKQQETLANSLTEQIITAIERCEEQVGGFWSRRCRQLWDNVQTTRKYGPELDSLMQKARMNFTAGRIESALSQYALSETTARKGGQTELAMELGFTRASILLDQKQFENAASEFLRLASEYSKNERAAKAHLLGIYSLGRLLDEKKSEQRRQAYTDAIDRHLKDYPGDATLNEARFLRAQLEEQRLQATQALPLYLQVEAGHARADDAMFGAARCYETILRRLNERRLPSADFQREAIERLSQFLTTRGDSTETWTASTAEIALRLANVLLIGSSEISPAADAGSPRATARLQVDISSRCRHAESWLTRVTAFASQHAADVSNASTMEEFRKRTAPLRIVALTGMGNTADAEQILSQKSVSPAQMLDVVDKLTWFLAATAADEQKRISSVLRLVIQQLDRRRDELSAEQCQLLDQYLIRAYAATGEIVKTVDLAKRLSEQFAKDADKQRELARLLSEIPKPEAVSLTKQCWRRVESLTKPGSLEWLTARKEVLTACIRLDQFDEAHKLIQLTKVLYPDLGGEPLKAQLEAIERDLQSRKKR